jgi:hypothetical protein
MQGSPRVADQVPDLTAVEIASANAPEPTAKSLWTPSYSVDVQGSPRLENVVEQLPDLTTEEATAADGPEPRPKSPWTPSYSVSVQGSPRVEPAADQLPDMTAATEMPAPDDGKPRPQSPWSPSYSVSTQGSPRLDTVGASLPDPTKERMTLDGVKTSALSPSNAPNPLHAEPQAAQPARLQTASSAGEGPSPNVEQSTAVDQHAQPDVADAFARDDPILETTALYQSLAGPEPPLVDRLRPDVSPISYYVVN